MIITNAARLSVRDPERFSWGELRRFHNVEAVQTLISDIHKAPRSDPNVKKQATQIRYCLQQAREYFDSAKAVSLVTKPVLLYYSIMNLALAEVLLKQDGNSSLDKAREQHRHHGLTFEFADHGRQALPLAKHAGAIRACPAIRPVKWAPERFGTFELWHRSCRPLPLVGMVTEFAPSNLSLSKFEVLSTPDEERPPLLPELGITLLECFRLQPNLERFLYNDGIKSDLVRATLALTVTSGDNRTAQFIIHPGNKGTIDEFLSNLKLHAECVDRIEIQQHADGSGAITLHDYHERFQTPPNLGGDTEMVYFAPRQIALNEFGLLYVALFICGNYARYYPDFWIRDVETHSPLALAIEQLISDAEKTMALLTLSELSRVYYVPEA